MEVHRCSAGLTQFCSSIAFNPNGTIRNTILQQLNLSGLQTAGLDVEARYDLEPDFMQKATVFSVENFFGRVARVDDFVAALASAGIQGGRLDAGCAGKQVSIRNASSAAEAPRAAPQDWHAAGWSGRAVGRNRAG